MAVHYVDNTLSENENEAVETHIPQQQVRFQDQKASTPRFGTKIPRHQEMEANKPQHRDSKTFFQGMNIHGIEIQTLKNHNITIPRPKSHVIKFLGNSIRRH